MNRLIAPAKSVLPVFLLLLLLIALPIEAQQRTGTGQPEQSFDTWDPTDEGMKTGPAIGENIPNFEATDQNGKLTNFKDIVGPNGALILFHRSADW